MLWNFVILMIIIYYEFEIGLLLAYGENVWKDELQLLEGVNITFITLLIIDVLLMPLKAYYEMGLLITSTKTIYFNYIKLPLWIDLLGIFSICLPLLSRQYYLNAVKLLILLKLYSAYQLDEQFQKSTQIKLKYHITYMLLRIVLLLCLSSHWIGIFYYIVSYYVFQSNYYGPNTPNICWIYNAQSYSFIIFDLDWLNQYLYTMYFSLGTMSTIAYGDITPLNPMEVTYTCVALVAYTLFFAYFLSETLRLLAEIQAERAQHDLGIITISNLMRQNIISDELQIKIKSYFEQIWLREESRDRISERKMINSLPRKIQIELYHSLYYETFKDLKLVIEPESLHSQFLYELMKEIQQTYLISGQFVYQKGDKDCYSLYFFDQHTHTKDVALGVQNYERIQQDNQALWENNVSNLALCYEAKIFGEVQFFLKEPRSHWAFVRKITLIYRLQRKFLEQAELKCTQLEKQHLFIIRRDIKERLCNYCKKQGHHFVKCPLISYFPNTEQILKKKIIKNTLKQIRRLVIRPQKKQIHCYKAETHKNKFKINSKMKNTLLVSNHSYQIQDIQSDSSSSSSQTSSSESQNLQNYIVETRKMMEKVNNSQNLINLGNTSLFLHKNLDFQLQVQIQHNFQIYQPNFNLSSLLQERRKETQHRKVQSILQLF